MGGRFEMAGIPLASQEVRWFLDGPAEQHPALKDWFEKGEPFQMRREGPVQWKGRLNDRADIYLLVPGSEDMGIKWREQELQVKGRVASLGTQVFCGRHQGRVERWVKWSYARMPDAYRDLFEAAQHPGLARIEVRKTRALRKIHLDTMTGETEEVDAGTFVDRGVGIELTNLKVDGKAYCSLAFEAFPDDSAMNAAFTGAVEVFLQGLTGLDLTADQSRSYPTWLKDLAPH